MRLVNTISPSQRWNCPGSRVPGATHRSPPRWGGGRGPGRGPASCQHSGPTLGGWREPGGTAGGVSLGTVGLALGTLAGRQTLCQLKFFRNINHILSLSILVVTLSFSFAQHQADLSSSTVSSFNLMCPEVLQKCNFSAKRGKFYMKIIFS